MLGKHPKRLYKIWEKLLPYEDHGERTHPGGAIKVKFSQFARPHKKPKSQCTTWKHSEWSKKIGWAGAVSPALLLQAQFSEKQPKRSYRLQLSFEGDDDEDGGSHILRLWAACPRNNVMQWARLCSFLREIFGSKEMADPASKASWGHIPNPWMEAIWKKKKEAGYTGSPRTDHRQLLGNQIERRVRLRLLGSGAATLPQYPRKRLRKLLWADEGQQKGWINEHSGSKQQYRSLIQNGFGGFEVTARITEMPECRKTSCDLLPSGSQKRKPGWTEAHQHYFHTALEREHEKVFTSQKAGGGVPWRDFHWEPKYGGLYCCCWPAQEISSEKWDVDVCHAIGMHLRSCVPGALQTGMAKKHTASMAGRNERNQRAGQ